MDRLMCAACGGAAHPWTEQCLRKEAKRIGLAGFDWERAFTMLRESFALPIGDPWWMLAESRWREGKILREMLPTHQTNRGTP